jgi:hypothetical protein
MDPADRDALIHMLVAQREQINASLRLLTKDEPFEVKPVEKNPGPRVLGRGSRPGG